MLLIVKVIAEVTNCFTMMEKGNKVYSHQDEQYRYSVDSFAVKLYPRREMQSISSRGPIIVFIIIIIWVRK